MHAQTKDLAVYNELIIQKMFEKQSLKDQIYQMKMVIARCDKANLEMQVNASNLKRSIE